MHPKFRVSRFIFLRPLICVISEEIIMDMAVQGTVNTAVALKDFNIQQDVQAALLKKVLASNAQLITGLINSVPKLAASGSVGTMVNTAA